MGFLLSWKDASSSCLWKGLPLEALRLSQSRSVQDAQGCENSLCYRSGSSCCELDLEPSILLQGHSPTFSFGHSVADLCKLMCNQSVPSCPSGLCFALVLQALRIGASSHCLYKQNEAVIGKCKVLRHLSTEA